VAARETSQQTSRAYMIFDGVHIDYSNDYLDGKISWRNIGQTPGYIYLSDAYMIEAAIVSDETEFVRSMLKDGPENNYLGAAGNAAVFDSIFETDDERDINGYKLGKIKRYIFGKIVYKTFTIIDMFINIAMKYR
jgi:hypothetical protein